MELSRAPVLHRPEPENVPSDPPSRRGVPRSLVLASELGWRFLVVVAAIAVLAYGLWYVRLVALPAFLALLLSTILVPPARALRPRGVRPARAPLLVFLRAPPRRRGLRPALATFIVFLGGLLVVAGVGALVVPAFASEVGKLSDTVTGGAQELGRLLAGPLGLSHDQVQSAIDSVSRKLHASGGDIASGVMSGAVIAGQIVAAALLTLVLLFFYVKDGASLWRWTVRLFPAGVRPRVDDAGRQSWLMLGAYVRGQALVATVDAVFIGIGLAIIGLPLVLPLAVLIFVGAFVPIVGAFVAGAAAVLIALVSKGAGAALAVLALN